MSAYPIRHSGNQAGDRRRAISESLPGQARAYNLLQRCSIPLGFSARILLWGDVAGGALSRAKTPKSRLSQCWPLYEHSMHQLTLHPVRRKAKLPPCSKSLTWPRRQKSSTTKDKREESLHGRNGVFCSVFPKTCSRRTESRQACRRSWTRLKRLAEIAVRPP